MKYAIVKNISSKPFYLCNLEDGEFSHIPRWALAFEKVEAEQLISDLGGTGLMLLPETELPENPGISAPMPGFFILVDCFGEIYDCAGDISHAFHQLEKIPSYDEGYPYSVWKWTGKAFEQVIKETP